MAKALRIAMRMKRKIILSQARTRRRLYPPVVRIAGQRSGVKHELAAGCAVIGGDEGGLHAKLIRRAGLALADALDLRSVEGIELPAALALLLRADLVGARQRP